jgi:hypothetical protein
VTVVTVPIDGGTLEGELTVPGASHLFEEAGTLERVAAGPRSRWAGRV